MENQIEPTTCLGLKVWWAFTWRGVGLGFLGAMAIGFIIGLVGALLSLSQSLTIVVSGLLGLCFGIYMMARVMRRMMMKGFGRYRLVVVEKDA